MYQSPDPIKEKPPTKFIEKAEKTEKAEKLKKSPITTL